MNLGSSFWPYTITNFIYALLRSDAFRSRDFSFIRSHWADRYNCQKILQSCFCWSCALPLLFYFPF